MTAAYDKTKKYQLLDEVGFKKYFKAENWAGYNQQFFDGLAPKYDALNQVLSFGRHDAIKKRAVGRLDMKPNSKILDLCTGTGDIPLLISKRYPACKIVGIDASEKMLTLARARAKNFPNIQYEKADVLNLPFQNRTFDFTIISFGLRNLDDLEKGILEMKRVTKSGGVMMNLDLGKPSSAWLRWIHKIYFETTVPLLGKLFFHRNEFNSFHYLPASGKYFPDQRTLVSIFSHLGFADVKSYDFMFGAIAQHICKMPS